MKLSDKRKNYLKTIGMSLLISACLDGAFAVFDLKSTVEEYDKHESGIARIVLGGGGVWSLARTFQSGGLAPLGIYGGGVLGYYLIHKARPDWFPL